MSVSPGGCLCGSVRFVIEGPLRPIVYCHCGMCRRATGHFLAATACALGQLSFTRSDGLKWYRSSAQAERGFCGQCGSNLFWKPDSGSHMSILAGALDDTAGLKAAAHIHLADKPAYYDIDDHLARHSDGAHGVTLPDARV